MVYKRIMWHSSLAFVMHYITLIKILLCHSHHHIIVGIDKTLTKNI